MSTPWWLKGFDFEQHYADLRRGVNSRRRPSGVSQGKRKRIYERDGYACLECGDRIHLTIDHVIPRSRGGSSREDNLQTLCYACNQRKGSA